MLQTKSQNAINSSPSFIERSCCMHLSDVFFAFFYEPCRQRGSVARVPPVFGWQTVSVIRLIYTVDV